MKFWAKQALYDRPTPYHGVICVRYWDHVVITCLIPFNVPLRLAVIAWRWLQTPFRSRRWQPGWYWRKCRDRYTKETP